MLTLAKMFIRNINCSSVFTKDDDLILDDKRNYTEEVDELHTRMESDKKNGKEPDAKLEKRLVKLLTQVARMEVLEENEARDYIDPGLARSQSTLQPQLQPLEGHTGVPIKQHEEAKGPALPG